MIELRAHCKINLGLRVLRRRDDGFHDIETVMMPLRELYDTVSVEALPTAGTFVTHTPPPYPAPTPVFPTGSILEVTGSAELDCGPEQNICMRALRSLQREQGIGEAVIRLEKVVPAGAGLGGGSADAAMVLRALNKEFVLEMSDGELEFFGARLGSDVPFFLRGGTQLCSGRGEVMTPAEVDLRGWWLAVVKPPAAVSTADAYAAATPHEDGEAIVDILRRPVGLWRELLRNDFEESVFARHPEIRTLKRALYDAGAVYASMSGSGSAVFGIFESRPVLSSMEDLPGPIFRHIERLG